MNLNKFLQAYLECALWSSNEQGGDPLDQNYSKDDITPPAWDEMHTDCETFILMNVGLLAESGLSDEQAGHDFWLTRNGHGTGFWDRDLGQVGENLSANAETFGSCDLYVGDDGQLHLQ